MKTFVKCDKEDSQHGLPITLTKSIQDQMTVLQGQIRDWLAGHPEAMYFCLEIAGAAMDFWGAYVPMFIYN